MSDYCWDGTHADEALPKSECVACLQARIKELEKVAEAAVKVIPLLELVNDEEIELHKALRAAGYFGGGGE